MLKAIAQKIGFVIALILMQVSFFPGLGLPFSRFNFALTCLIFMGFLFSFRSALIYGFIVGALLERYSGLPFGAMMLAIMIPLAVTSRVFLTFLTNRSFYTILILVFGGTLICQLILSTYLGWDVFAESKILLPEFLRQAFLTNFLYSVVMNLSFVSILYFVFSLFTRQFSVELSKEWE